MKVAMIAPYPRDFGRPNGGVEAAVEALASAVARLDAEVCVYDPFTGYPEVADGLNHSVKRLPPVSTFGALALRAPTELSEAVSSRRPDLVHVHLGTRLTRIHSPSVLTVHGFPHIETKLRNPGMSGRFRSAVLKRAFESGIRQASTVVAISPETRRAAEKAGVPSISIPNPIAREFFDVERNGGKQFVSIGNIIRLKNQVQLIEAFRRYVAMGGDGDLVIIGAIDDQDYFDLCRKAAKPVSSRVHFAGALPRLELPAILATAKASVSASLRETSSIAVAESFAANCPVISLDVGTAKDQVKDSRFGEVLASNSTPEDFAIAMSRIGSGRVSGEPLRESVAGQHPDEVGRLTVKLYRSLLQRP